MNLKPDEQQKLINALWSDQNVVQEMFLHTYANIVMNKCLHYDEKLRDVAIEMRNTLARDRTGQFALRNLLRFGNVTHVKAITETIDDLVSKDLHAELHEELLILAPSTKHQIGAHRALVRQTRRCALSPDRDRRRSPNRHQHHSTRDSSRISATLRKE